MREELTGLQAWDIGAGERENTPLRDLPRVLVGVGFHPQQLRLWRTNRHPCSPERSTEIRTLQPATSDTGRPGGMHDEGVRFERAGESLSRSHETSLVEEEARRIARGLIGGKPVCLSMGGGPSWERRVNFASE